MIARKQSVVDQTTKGIDFLMDKNKIEVYHGMGSFKDATHIEIKGDSDTTIEARNTIIATGSKSAMPKAFGVLPKADVLVKPYPEFAESGSGEYHSRKSTWS